MLEEKWPVNEIALSYERLMSILLKMLLTFFFSECLPNFGSNLQNCSPWYDSVWSRRDRYPLTPAAGSMPFRAGKHFTAKHFLATVAPSH